MLSSNHCQFIDMQRSGIVSSQDRPKFTRDLMESDSDDGQQLSGEEQDFMAKIRQTAREKVRQGVTVVPERPRPASKFQNTQTGRSVDFKQTSSSLSEEQETGRRNMRPSLGQKSSRGGIDDILNRYGVDSDASVMKRAEKPSRNGGVIEKAKGLLNSVLGSGDDEDDWRVIQFSDSKKSSGGSEKALQERIRELEAQVSRHDATCQRYRDVIDEKERGFASLTEKFHLERDKTAELRCLLAEKNQALEDSETNVDKLTRELRASAGAEDMKVLQKEVEHLREDNSKLASFVQALRTENAGLVEKADDFIALQASFKKKNDEASRLCRIVERLEAEAVILKRENGELNAAMMNHRRNGRRVVEDEDEKDQTIAKLMRRLERAEKALEDCSGSKDNGYTELVQMVETNNRLFRKYLRDVNTIFKDLSGETDIHRIKAGLKAPKSPEYASVNSF